MLYLYDTVAEMTNRSYFKKGTISFRAIALIVAICLVLGGIFSGSKKTNKQEAIAYSLPSPTKILSLSRWQSYPVLKGIRINPENPLNLEFIIDTVDKDGVTKEEASRLIRYFLAGLTLPDEELWVNLSPYEEERVVSDSLSLTDLGKDMLGQDYILKQLLSSLTYPEDKLGREYWKEVYQEVARIAGTTNIPINTFNKVWIMPDKAKVYENGNVAFVTKATLKCMLEEDYLALKNNSQTADDNPENKEEISKVASKIMKQIVLPKIQEDVSHGKNFATLRQVYHSLILGVWFKQKFKDSFYKYYIDQGKIRGIDLEDKGAKEKIYDLYVQAYKKGVYDYIRSDYDTASRKYIDRRYYSGGVQMSVLAPNVEVGQELPPGASSPADFFEGKAKAVRGQGEFQAASGESSNRGLADLLTTRQIQDMPESIDVSLSDLGLADVVDQNGNSIKSGLTSLLLTKKLNEPVILSTLSGREIRIYVSYATMVGQSDRPTAGLIKQASVVDGSFELFIRVFKADRPGNLKVVLRNPEGDYAAKELWFDRTQEEAATFTRVTVEDASLDDFAEPTIEVDIVSPGNQAIDTFVQTLNSEEGQRRLGDVVQGYTLDGFNREYKLDVLRDGVGDFYSGEQNSVGGSFAPGLHTHPMFSVFDDMDAEDVLTEDRLSRLPIYPSMTNPAEGQSDLHGGVGMVIAGTEAGGFWGLAFDSDMVLDRGFADETGALWQSIAFWYERGAFKLYKIVDLNPDTTIQDDAQSGAKQFMLQEVTLAEFKDAWDSLKFKTGQIRENILARYRQRLIREQQLKAKELEAKRQELTENRTLEKINPKALMQSGKVTNIGITVPIDNAITSGDFAEAMRLIDRAVAEGVPGKINVGNLLERMRFDSDPNMRQNIETFLNRHEADLKIKLGFWFPDISPATASVLKQKQDSSTSNKSPKPRFGDSGTDVDKQFVQAQKEIELAQTMRDVGVDTADSHLQTAAGHVAEAMRLLQEDEDAEVTIGFIEVARWVLEQLDEEGHLNNDPEARRVLVRLRNGQPVIGKKAASPADNLGGIDFNRGQFNIETQGQGMNLPANIPFSGNIEGLTFTIITIEDLSDFELSQLIPD